MKYVSREIITKDQTIRERGIEITSDDFLLAGGAVLLGGIAYLVISHPFLTAATIIGCAKLLSSSSDSCRTISYYDQKNYFLDDD